jgi:hypothetical protein
MAKLLLLNPIKRAKKKSHTRRKKPRSAAQKAATKRMLAANKASKRARRSGRKHKKHHAKKSHHVGVASPSRATHKAPSKRLKRRRSRNNVKGYFPNPVGAHVAKRRKASRRRAHRRHNPISIRGAMSRPMGVLKPALAGAAGALAVNGIVNYMPGLPDSLKTGNMLHITKAVLALAIGTFGPKIPGVGKHAAKMAEGALTVVATDVAKQLAMTYGYNLSGTGFVSPAQIVSSGNVRSLASAARAGMYVNGVSGMSRAAQYVSRAR